MIKETYNSIDDTKKHISLVKDLIDIFCSKLFEQIESHDNSKLKEPELSIFNEYTPKLKYCTYGSEEYKQYLREMKIALDHHYQNNRHHPEYFENGMMNMNLIDIIEMFCDWLASTKRHNDGNIYNSIELNKKRFKYPEMIENIFKNTATDIFKM